MVCLNTCLRIYSKIVVGQSVTRWTFFKVSICRKLEQEQWHVDIITFIEISLVSDLALALDYLVVAIPYPKFICFRTYNFFNLDNAKTNTTTAIIAINT